MLPKISNCFFSILFLLPLVVSAQTTAKKDSIKTKIDPADFKPTGVRFGWDAINTYRLFIKDNYKGWEVNGDIDFRNYYLAVDVGHSKREVTLSNGDYENSGNYWKAGIDINMMKKDPAKNMLFLGFRVGHSNYNEQLNYSDTTEFGIFNKTLNNQALKANWFELTTGIKIRIIKGFWMGYTARMKFSASYSKDQNLQTYDIPGYGLTYKKPWWGFNYYLMYRIPIRKNK